jgi:retron-type reverse transcriptase
VRGGGDFIAHKNMSEKNNITYNTIISIRNLYEAWREFLRGKQYKKDVTEFRLNLSHNIFLLYEDLKNKTYHHSGYTAFSITDPKPRSIHKAIVRDRLLHHAIYRMLYPFFDTKFIYDSYSCRQDKGTHKAMDRFNHFYRKVSQNNRKRCWVLKCDIRKFFASIDHALLMDIIKRHISDKGLIWLIDNVVSSFYSNQKRKGLPLGNLTSQLLVNVYMNEFDQYVKHVLKQKYYIRYADDFVFMSQEKRELEEILLKINEFLLKNLKLSLHPDKVFIKTFVSGVDFLGWVHFPTHRVLRTVTKMRMLRNINQNSKELAVRAYLGMLSHGNGFKLKKYIGNKINL